MPRQRRRQRPTSRRAETPKSLRRVSQASSRTPRSRTARPLRPLLRKSVVLRERKVPLRARDSQKPRRSSVSTRSGLGLAFSQASTLRSMPAQPPRLAHPPSQEGHCFSEELEALPTQYGLDALVLQVRDPYWIHAYWEITPETEAKARRELGGEGLSAEKILRVYDEDSPRFFDIPVSPVANDWYLEVSPSDRAWTVELGLKSRSGGFVKLLRSNTVRTPPDRPSERIDERWGWLRSIPEGWPAPSSMERPRR